MANGTLIGVLMITGGLVLVSSGIFVMTRWSPGLQASPSTTLGDDAAPTSEEKGRAFEEWVVRKFDRDYFTLKEWRSDKMTDGISPQSSENPDLEIEVRTKDVRATFAVECKWRKGFEPGEKPGIRWATERQIANYREYARDRGIPVFVVIGIGGQPDDPGDLFVANLNRLKYPHATAEYLARFRRRNRDSGFYYDAKQSELR